MAFLDRLRARFQPRPDPATWSWFTTLDGDPSWIWFQSLDGGASWPWFQTFTVAWFWTLDLADCEPWPWFDTLTIADEIERRALVLFEKWRTDNSLEPVTAEALADLAAVAGSVAIATDGVAALGTTDTGETVTLDRATRNKHLYLIGKSRTGKTTLMLNLMRGDLNAGDGLTFIDPAGDAAHQLLGYVPASRLDDVTYFDPTREDCPPLNLLALPYDRDKLAGEIVSAFALFFNITPASAPRMIALLRNGLLALLDDRVHEPHSIAHLEKLYKEPPYRQTITRRATDERVQRFLTDDLPRFDKSALDPVLNKLDAFLSTRTLARLFGATTNALDFDALLNRHGVLICSLSKGKIGEEPAKFLGGLIVAALTVAALARADQPPAARLDHFLYVDEFQNFAVSSFATIFAEAAKYRLNLTVAHQTRDQLTPEIRAALGNASTYIVFRISYGDAANLSPELATRTAKPASAISRGQLVTFVRDYARTILDDVRTFPPDPDPSRDTYPVPQTPCVAWHRAPLLGALKDIARDPDTAAHRHFNVGRLAWWVDLDKYNPDLATVLAAHGSNLVYNTMTPSSGQPWPSAGDIINLENLHAFARIERPENTTAITVPFPPADDEHTEHARAAVLAAQANRMQRAELEQKPAAEKNRPQEKPQDERSASDAAPTPHPEPSAPPKPPAKPGDDFDDFLT